MNNYVFGLYGILFGALLSFSGATTYDNYAKLFLFQDLQLMWVIGVAAAVGALGLQLLKRLGNKTLSGESIVLTPKPWRRSLIPGALLLGVGWGLTGVCPGTSLAMVGQGKLSALVAAAGILFGTYLYGVFAPPSGPTA